MSRSLASGLVGVCTAFAVAMSLVGSASAAPLQIRFLDVDSASQGSYVGVYGAGFGDTQGNVQFGGVASIDVAMWTDALIIARVPAEAKTGPVTVLTDTNAQADSPVMLKIHSGAIYVVASSGNDTAAGDEDNPFQSLHKAVSVTKPGDTVLIRAGTYDEQDALPSPLPALYFRPENGGSDESPTTWRGYGSDVPVIRGTLNNTKNSPVIFVGGEYLRLARLEINGANNTSSGVSVWALNTWVVGLNIHNFGETGIFIGEVNSAMIAGNSIGGGGTRPGRDHGIHTLGSGATIRNNEIFDLPNGYGIFLERQGQGESDVFSNHLHDIAGGGIGLSRVRGGNRVCNNVVWNVGSSQGCRCAIEVAYGAAGGETAITDRVYYNTFVGPGFSGMYVADRDGEVEVHSNIFANFRVGMRVEDDASKPSISSSHNIWHSEGDPPQFKWGDGPWLDYIGFKNQSQEEDSSRLADPAFVDPDRGDMHLTSVSPGIDVGGGPDEPSVDHDGVARPHGAGHDIGAYEYTGQPGGTGGIGGHGGSAGAAGSGNSSVDGSRADSGDGGGCGCSAPRSHSTAPIVFMLGFAALAFGRRRGR